MNNKKKGNGWLVAVAIAVVALVIANGAIFAVLFNRIVNEEGGMTVAGLQDQDKEDEFDFDFEYNYRNDDEKEDEEEEESEEESKDNRDDDYPHSIGGSIDPSDYSYIDEDNGKEYYTRLKDAIRYDLDYSVSWKEYDYDSDYENVLIAASYPQLEGDNIPNLDYINDYIFDEVQFWVDSFEEYVDEGYFYEDDEFMLEALAYVTYMDEEKISIVFSEYGYADYESMAYLFSINIDVQNGVILENSSIIDMDDEFAVEFRKRNKEQNDASGFIDELSDQEIVEYLNSPTLGVVFYTPLGLEVGINLDDGWYTVTYMDYEKYLKKL